MSVFLQWYFFPAFTSTWACSIKPGESSREVTCPTCNVRPKPNYHIESKETVLAAILFSPSAEQGPLLASWAYTNVGQFARPPTLRSGGGGFDFTTLPKPVCDLTPPSCPCLHAPPKCCFLLLSNTGCF